MFNKEYLEKRLLWSTKTRNYITIPCIVVNAVATLYAVHINDHALATFNLLLAAYNVLVYTFSVWICVKYEQMSESLEKLNTKPVETETSKM